MGITKREIIEVTCDICGADCKETDSLISIQVNGGDGRDVGPAIITATLKFTQPYGCSNGIVCGGCKLKYLSAYVERLSPPARKSDG
jgi:hypothetical protein